jgi:hypothetical protein
VRDLLADRAGSGDYLLNAEYAYGLTHPELAPSGPTSDRGLNILMSSIGQMLGLPVDYYVKIDMAGFAEMIDALGGVTIDVGPVPLPIGGVLPDGTHVPASGYAPASIQHLDELLASCPPLTVLVEDVRAFADLLTTRPGGDLEDWLTAVEASDLPALHAFIRGLRKRPRRRRRRAEPGLQQRPD